MEGTTRKVWTQHKSTPGPSGDPPLIGSLSGTSSSVGIWRPRLTEVQIGSLGSPAFAPGRFVPEPVELLSVPLEPLKISTTGWVLPEGQAFLKDCPPSSWKPGPNTPTDERQSQLAALEANLQERGSGPSRGRTRVHPPRDVVKLEDRLRYLLEPPLESMLAGANLRFPHPRFLINWMELPFSTLDMRLYLQMKWVWGRRCRRSLPCGCWCTGGRCDVLC